MSPTAQPPRIRALLRQAERAAEARKITAATQLYRQIIDEAPDTVGAWLGLARLATNQSEKEAHYRKVLELEPDHLVAREEFSGLFAGSDGRPATGLEPDESTLSEIASQAEPLPASGVTTPVGQEAVEVSKVEPPVEKIEAIDDVVMVCANHPDRETSLRCNRCDKPICSQCAVPTPVGYRCKECIKEFEDALYSATAAHYALALAVSIPLALLASWLVARFPGFWVIFIAAIAGTSIGRIVFWAVGRKRGRWLPHLVAIVIIAAAAYMALSVAVVLGRFSFGLVWLLIFSVIASGSAYYQMK